MSRRKSGLEKLKRELQWLEEGDVKAAELPQDPVEFAAALFGFKATEYQARLLRDDFRVPRERKKH